MIELRDLTRALWKAGAVLYVIWGLMHIVVGGIPLFRYAASGPVSMLAFHELDVEAVDGSLEHASHLIAEHSANLIAFGILAIVVATTLVMRGRPLGFWINAIVLGAVDVSFVVAEITTGHLEVMPAGMGPVVYAAALAVTAVALVRQSRSTPANAAPAG